MKNPANETNSMGAVSPERRNLVVWHTKEFRHGIEGLLADLGHESITTSSPVASLAISAHCRCTIFLEAGHPEMSGLDFAAELRRAGASHAKARLVLVQEDRNYELAIEAFRLGAADVLVTPARRADLERNLDHHEGALPLQARKVPATSGSGDMTRHALDVIIAGRSLRSQFFSERHLLEPGWDMLLDLSRARLRGERLTTSAVCVGLPKSMATGLRVLRTMEDDGLVRRVDDPSDKRRSFVEVSDAALVRMEALLARIASMF